MRTHTHSWFQKVLTERMTSFSFQFYGPRIGALYVRGLGDLTPLYPMLFGGGQERNFRPG